MLLSVLAGACSEATGQAPNEAPARSPATEDPLSTPAAHPGMLDLLPRHVRGPRFHVFTDGDLPIDEFAAHAERRYNQIADWLKLRPDVGFELPIPIYLCSKVDTIYEIEARYGRMPSNHVGRSFDFQGGFYPEQGFIALPSNRFRELQPIVTHELAHVALSRLIENPPDIINEGLAELFQESLPNAERKPFATERFVNSYHQQTCELGLAAGDVLPLKQLFELGYWEFRDRKYQSLHFSLGWHLVRFLTESEHAKVTGRFPRFLTRLGRGEPAWRAFQITYDAALVEQLWHAELRRPAQWRPAFGAWRTVIGGFQTGTDAPSSAILLHDNKPDEDHDWELSYPLSAGALAVPGSAVGFIVAHKSDDDFRLISVRPSVGDVVFSHYQKGKWQSSMAWPLPTGRLAAGRLCLTIQRDGSLRVRLDTELLTSFPATPGVHGNGAGLMFELRRLGPGGVGAGYTFRDIRQQRGKPSRGELRGK